MEEENHKVEEKYIVSCGNYEGGLLGLSFKDFTDLDEMQTEYAFSATQGSINAIAGNNHMLALGGFHEVIKLYDLRTKKERGELMEHTGSITYLEFFETTYLISGSEDGLVIIWRVKDWVPLHKLKVKNVSKVLNFSLHPSGRMLLVVYDNNMFRLWNLLDGRCLFKRKLAVDEETNKVSHKALQVRWEPKGGHLYSILYDKKLEVYKPEVEAPLSSVSSDTTFNAFDFVSETEIVIADIQGKLTFVKNIEEEAKTTITLIHTKIARFRDLRCHPGSDVLVGVSTEGKISFYSVPELRKFHLEIGQAKPVKQIKSKSRFLCLAVNHVRPEEKKKAVKKTKEIKKKKQLGKKKKLSKDEKKLLQIQRKQNKSK
ncbi:hypothetical protein FGO68_gene7198 [Halteria grandinella]|uniref:Uncharacterized protein n=1 Tax=Halteria grandinella TaxID=5974 RepID=A0A8J8ND48_HALGN|nr:hypothetical protein FGO68_gene7198 [Halteria grandinella]